MQTAPVVLSVRNSSIVQYTDVSCLDIARNGCISSLKQNNNSIYKEAMRDFADTDELPVGYNDVNEFYKEYKGLYDKYKTDSENQKITLRPLGTLSKNQIRSCKRAVENMVNNVLINYKKKVNYKKQPYVAFVTLTLPVKQQHTDKVFRKMLVRFIENLTKTYKVKHYIWKAEPQKNGNIHFHLLIDRWVDKETIQNLWNKQLSNYGYIERYEVQMLDKGFVYVPFYIVKGEKIISKKSKKQQYKHYLYSKSIGFKNAPTTKIHSLEKVTNTVSYIMKYMTKQEHDKRQILGKIWGCANVTKKLDYPKFYDSEKNFDQVYDAIEKNHFKHLVKDDYINVYVGKVFSVISKYYKRTWNAIKRHYNHLNELTIEKYEEFKEFVSVKESVPHVENATEFLEKLAKSKFETLQRNKILNNKNALLRFKEKCISELHLYNPNQTILL